MVTMNNNPKNYFFTLTAILIAFTILGYSSVKNCNKIIDFRKLNGDFFSEIEIQSKTPILFSTNNYLMCEDIHDLGTLYYNDTSINLSNYLYANESLDSEINLSPLAVHKINLGKQKTYYLLTYQIQNFLGTNGEMLGILIQPNQKILTKLIYIPLSEIYTIGDADKNGKLDIITINNGEDNYLKNNSIYPLLLSEFDSNGNLKIKNKGRVLFTEPDLLMDSCKYSFLKY